MKKVVLSVAIMSFALLANAQVLKKDLLKDYKPGDQLEKAVYGDKKEPIRTDSWNGAFSTNPLEGVGSQKRILRFCRQTSKMQLMKA